MADEKWCTGCKSKHNVACFGKDRSRGDGLSATCKVFSRKKNKARTRNERDEANAKMRARRASETPEEKEARRANNRKIAKSKPKSEYQNKRKEREAKQDPELIRQKKINNYKKHYQKYRDSFHNSHLKKRYGITLKEYDRMLADQGGVCTICSSSSPTGSERRGGIRFSVDHDHKTGVIRGLICSPCNLGLGSFRDDPNSLRLAADYVERYRNNTSELKTINPIKLSRTGQKNDKGQFVMSTSDYS